MLMLAPGGRPRAGRAAAAGALVDAVCGHFPARGVTLAQVLLDPADAGARQLYLGRGFRQMAELQYLQADVRRGHPAPPLPPGFDWVTYSPAGHATFAATIVESYRDSLDCPGLNGVRDIEDVIAGHKSSGEFDPAWWFLLREAGRPVAVLLLSRTAHAGTSELVYLGLVPAARGRGLGDVVMRQALHAVASQGPGTLALAVDAGNAPAIRLYHRHGLRRVGSKLAMMRQLHPGAGPASGQLVPA
jgi:ribosomal protein S18 acetylase RimI-like enzyme